MPKLLTPENLYIELLGKISEYNPNVDKELLRKAVDFSFKAHEKQKRKSGEDFIIHPFETAKILADLKMDTETIVAALLHDVIEDAGVKKEEIEKEFNSEVAELVDGVTKLEKIKFSGQETQTENFRKMLVAMAKDIRVVMIKLADRLHNMKTIRHLSKEKQKIKALETLEIYSPIAHRLGIYTLKAELEDEAFKVLEPEKYALIEKLVKETTLQSEKYINSVIEAIKKELEKVNIMAEVTGRIKHYYSIYQKMKKSSKEFGEIHDLFAVRVITNNLKDCYAALGVIHSLWKPVPGRFKDYIAVPKFNMYQSLHTTVIGPEGKQLEVQIRTKEMHRIAEYGVAAHWRYKEGLRKPDEFDERLSWLRRIIELEEEFKDSKEFLKALKMDVLSDEVFVFTPKGDVISLPKGSTPIDFAYTIHTEVGHRCVGAIVNGKIVPLDYELKSGDQVKILTSNKAQGPSRDWLDIVRTSRAKTKIRAWFSREERLDRITRGRDEFIKYLRKSGIYGSITLDSQEVKELAKEYNQKTVDDFFAQIGSGFISPKQAVTKLIKKISENVEEVEEIEAKTQTLEEDQARTHSAIIVKGVGDVLVRFAKCCTPVPGDSIGGYITRGRGISIHRTDCPNFKELVKSQPDAIVEVSWAKKPSTTFKVHIKVLAVDRPQLLKDITAALSDAGVNIVSANLQTTKEGLAAFNFVFEIGNTAILDKILQNIKSIENVFDAYRV
ncbi:MAG: bifunctional (p)ppGpp synthetase/guanosine-3',5'-bis(diphosphate) 3'-pyrophosphohydrolase [Actinobacteria bacterium]|nr:bifunctional (p)ppGpp synthetase/guanosine-3',5'-bis(diphosphate) 3'-pyrophosphohydrolase [Actinomycetota bacterium]